MVKAQVSRKGNNNDVHDTFTSVTSNSIMSVGMQDSTGNYVVSSGLSLYEPILSVQKDGTVIIENDLVVKGNQTVITSNTINYESPQLDIGLVQSDITFIKQIHNSNVSQDYGHALINLQSGNPAEINISNATFSGIYVNNVLSTTYNKTYPPGGVTNSSIITLLPNISSTTKYNIDFTSTDAVFLDLTSSSSTLVNTRVALSTTLPLRIGSTLVGSQTITNGISNTVTVSCKNGFPDSGILLLRDNNSIGTYTNTLIDQAKPESTITDKYTIRITFGSSSSVPIIGDYLAGTDPTGNVYVLGNIASLVGPVSGSTVIYDVKFNNAIGISSINSITATTTIQPNSNIYSLKPVSYNGIKTITGGYQFTNVIYNGSSPLTLNVDSVNAKQRMQVYSLLPITPSNNFYLGNNSATSNSINNSSITCMVNDSELTSLPIFDNSPSDILLLLEEYCIWNFDSSITSALSLSTVNGSVGFMQANTTVDGLYKLKWHFTDNQNNDVSKQIACGNTTNDTLFFSKNVNGTQKPFFTFDFNDESLAFNNGGIIQNQSDGIININARSQNTNTTPIINIDSDTNGTVNLKGGLNMNSGKVIIDNLGNATIVGDLVVSGSITADNNLVNLNSNGDSNFGGIVSVTNTTESTHPGEGSIVTKGGVGIGKNLNILGIENIMNTTDSTSISNGALVVSGGVGIAKNLYIAGKEHITNTTDSTSISTGALVVSGGVGISKSLNVEGNTNITGIESITNTTESTSTSNGALVVSGGVGITKNLNVAGIENITNTTESTSISTGALVVSGGVGITKNLYISGKEHITNTTDSTSTSNGALVISGGVGITKNLNIAGIENITNATDSTSISTGALVVTGGVGIGGTLNVGGNTNITGIEHITNVTDSTSVSTGALVVSGGVGITKTLNVAGIENITNTTESTSISTGALIVSGGVGITKNLYIAGKEHITNTTDSTSVSNGALIVSGGVGIAKSLNVGSTTDSSSTSTGAVVISGGVGIAKSLHVGSTTDSGSYDTGAVIIAGGVGIGKSLHVAGIIKGNEITCESDVRLKENIITIDNSLQKVLSMRGVYFDWINKEKYNDRHQIGFIAQEVEKVFPELVMEIDNIKHVNYSQTVSILIEAIKDQQNIINQMRIDIDELKNKKPRTYKKKVSTESTD